MKKMWLVSLILVMVCSSAAAASNEGESTHWAADELALMRALGADIPAEKLGEEIAADEWERMVTAVFAPVLIERHKDYQYWINTYTHLNLRDGRIERRWAVAGLVKLLNGAGKAPGSFSGEDAQLERIFADTSEIGEMNEALWEIAYRLGLVKGYPDKTLSPEKHLTYAEAAVLLDRAFERVAEHRFGYIEAVIQKEQNGSLLFDEANWFTNEAEIKEAMVEDGMCPDEVNCSIPNGFYIQNESDAVEQVELSAEAVILLWDPESEPDQLKRVVLADFHAVLADKQVANEADLPYHLYHHNGTVVKVVQQYLP
ncbi:MAG: S-layer homology domain-containing protein [Brevibacillus sp.]|nr:S-layer homology domain-containing protein [Brevibacillus sp.]